jgi:Na+/H+ antiporter NhaD/arsenite permease-like protein
MLAVMPLIASRFWKKHEWTVLLSIALISVVCTYVKLPNFKEVMYHSLVDDYLPFIIMVFTLYVLSNGIHVKIKASSSTLTNTIFLGVGNIFASLIGTTGASVLLLHSFLAINKGRQHKTHLVIFFILTMANIGGMLTPLGDAPILLGYLHGVDFEWSLVKLFPIWFVSTAICMACFYLIDKFFLRKEREHIDTEAISTQVVDEVNTVLTDEAVDELSQECDGKSNRRFSISISGLGNVTLLLLTVVTLFVEFQDLIIGSITISHMLIRNMLLLTFAAISLFTRKCNDIDFSPFSDVAKTFLVIFITIAPVVSILDINSDRIHALFMQMTDETNVASVYFWICSITSAFLDNAPSYLLFFNIAGGDANALMSAYPNILVAISSSSVIMGAITYIGNAPNLIVRSIAEKRGIKMPSFIEYMAWAGAIILPIGVILTLLIGWMY